MVKGILADVNVEGHFALLLHLFGQESRRELWTFLHLSTPTFSDLGLVPEDTDRVVWQKCQEQQVLLITANRNDKGSESLESTIRTLNQPDSLPVVTFANAERFLADRTYAEQTADNILELLFDIENYRGTGRVFAP
jgi:hypothetical protein